MRVHHLLFALLAGALVLLSSCSTPYVEPIMEPTDARSIAHGRELVRGVAACGYCHGESADPSALLSGGRTIFDEYGALPVPNITPDKSGVGGWTTEQMVDAIRGGMAPGDRELALAAHSGFEWMADRDVLAVIAYLRTVPPVAHEVERRDFGFMERNTIGLLEHRREVRGFVPSVDPSHEIQFGQYLVENVARCTSCHNKPDTLFTSEAYLDGGATVVTSKGERVAPNITGSRIYGIGDWKLEQITHYLATGQRRDQSMVDPAYCPTNFYANASERDRRAIARYLLAVVAE